jgi:tetratricopeptide (TPR) repeat protein
LATTLGDLGAHLDPGRLSVDDTIGAFLEPLDGAPDPDALVTVTDDTPTRPFDEIVVEEDRPDEITLGGFPASEPEDTEGPPPSRAPALEPSEEVPVGVAPAVPVAEVAESQPESTKTPLATWAPPTDTQTWTEVAEAVERAAFAADGAASAALWLEAARIRRDRLDAVDEAAANVDRARAAGADDEVTYTLLADLSGSRGDLAGMVEALARRAERVSGPAAAEAWQAGAMVARHRLKDLEASENQLRRAVTADPLDYASLSLLRDQLSVRGREADRAEVLTRICEIARGRVAAEAWWELGRLLHRLGQESAATDAYRKGRNSDQTHAPCFLALQALLVAAADDVAVAELYTEEALRSGQLDVGYWHLEAARAWVDARMPSQADSSFQAAIAAGAPGARREYQAFLIGGERWADYAASLRDEANATSGPARAFVLYRLGRQLEDLHRVDEAIVAYREAVDLDAAAGPAAEAAARLLQGAGRFTELLELWEARVAGTDDTALRSSVLLRMAEVAEAGQHDDGMARAYLERILAYDPGDRPALDALRRVYGKMAAWPELAGVYRALGDTEDSIDAKAQNYAREGNVWRYRVGDAVPAAAAWRRALELRPAHAIALDELVDLLEETGEWPEQAAVLRVASDAATPEAERARLAYRAGRVWLDRLGEVERAAEAFRHALRFQPSFLPALGMLKQIAARAGETTEMYRLVLQQAQGLAEPAARHWRLLAAADLAARLPGGDPGRDLGAILEREPAHPGALAGQELRLLTLGAKVGLLNLYRRALQGLEPGQTRTDLLVRVAGLFEALGDAAGVREPIAEVLASEDRAPMRALARLAEGQRHWAEAAEALLRAGSPEDRLERARLLAQRLERHDEAMAAYEALLGEADVALGAALGAAALAQRAGDADLLLRAHAVLAEHAGAPPVQAAHGLWSGQLAEAANQSDEALRLYRLSLAHRPQGRTAFEGARRQLVRLADSEGLRTLWEAHQPHDVHGLASDLEKIGDKLGVARVWEQAVSAGTVPAVAGLAQLEVARAATEDWAGVYEAATRRSAATSDPVAKELVDAKRRWILANKLSETEEAWNLYRALHEEDPDNREVTSALARIALARGETRLAIAYLEALTSGADPDEAAALRVRMGEVHEAAGGVADARQAYLDALDHRPELTEALRGLRRLAEAAGDWPAVIDVMRRESHLVQGDARVAALVGIAETTQARLGDAGQSADAWRRVLEVAPNHHGALSALMALTEGRDFPAWVEAARQRVEQVEGAERTSLLARIGDVLADEIEDEEASSWWERALREGPASEAACRRLLALYTGRGDSTHVVRLTAALAEIVSDPQEKATLYGDAATIEADVRNDKVYAARLFERAMEHRPDDPRALRFLARFLYEAGRHDEALVVFERLAPTVAEGVDLDDFDVRMELGTFFYRLAVMMTEKGRGGEAIPPAVQALAYNRNHQPTLELLAPLYIREKRWDDANEVLRQLLQLTGGQGDKQKVAAMYAQLGQVERALGRPDKAALRYSKALDLVPNFVPALKGMTVLLEEKADWSALLNVYNNIIYHAPDPADVTAAYLTKGRILDEHMGRADKAAQHYEKSLAYDASQPSVLARLAELALRRGDWAEAAAAAQRGLDLGNAGSVRADLYVLLAIARHGGGDPSRAATALAEASALRPDLELSAAALENLDDTRERVRARLPR